MEETLTNIRNMLDQGLYTDEQHVRISLVARICRKLGWNIWNPTEFNTEYRVIRSLNKNGKSEEIGRVDVALIRPEKKPHTPDVFIEVKCPRKLNNCIYEAQSQLHNYCHVDKPSIVVLTDGYRWQFFLPSKPGKFDATIINDFKIMECKIDDIMLLFERILSRAIHRKGVIPIAESIFTEYQKIKLIQDVKQEAEINTEGTNNKFAEAVRLIKLKHGVTIGIKVVIDLWDRKIALGRKKIPEKVGGTKKVEIPKTNHPIKHAHVEDTFTNTEISKVRIFEKWYEVASWKEVKILVYKLLIDDLLGVDLSKWYSISQSPSIFKRPLLLSDGLYTEGNLRAYNIVKHVYKAMSAIGFDPTESLEFVTTPPQNPHK